MCPEVRPETLNAPAWPRKAGRMRRLLKVFLILASLVVVVVVGFGAFLAWSYVTAKVDTVGEVDFDRPLAIPPLAESQVDDRGRRVFDLSLQTGRHRLRPGRPDADVGLQRRLPRADAAGRAGRAGAGQRRATSWTRRPPCTGTACTCRPRWTAGRTSRSRRAAPGRRPGGSTSRPRPSGTTRTRTARPPSTSTGAWPGCSSSTTRATGGAGLPRSTASTTSR